MPRTFACGRSPRRHGSDHLASGAAALTLSIRVWIESGSGINELTCPVPLW